ncbi:MAG: LysM peptidoglycan-binding domain-containing protein [Desulfococcaceae bacterium]
MIHRRGKSCNIPGMCLFTLLALVPALNLYAEEKPGVKSPVVAEDGQGGAYYTIQKGDTLWDLSGKFLNSPWYWPELWKENSDIPIPNPHLIYPGQQIRLFRKGQMPGTVPAQQPEAVSAPVPADVEIIPTVEPETEEVISDDGTPHYVFAPISQVGFIRKEAVKSSGIIFMEKDGKRMISKGDTVFVRPSEEKSLILGKYYTVYRTSSPLTDKKTKEFIGIQHLILGIVEIVQDDPDFKIGRVVQSYRNIKVDDLLMPHTAKSPKIPFVNAREGIMGKIIASEDHNSMMGQHDIAFIDKGTADGVLPGQQYQVYEEKVFTAGTGPSEKTIRTPMDFGKVLVLHSEETASTVLIIQSQKNIQPGELIRSPVQ